MGESEEIMIAWEKGKKEERIKMLRDEIQLREQERIAFVRIKQKNVNIDWLRDLNYGRITDLKSKLDALCVEEEP